MNEFESPIEVAVNTNRLFIEGLHAVLDLQLRNRSIEDKCRFEVYLSGRLLQGGVRRKLTLGGGATRKTGIDLPLPRAATGRLGSAGDARFDVELIVDAGDEGRHRFTGEFILAVLEYTENRSDININIHKLIEQTGDAAGMGAINEINMRDFIKLPENMSVNDMIREKRPPRFVPIELDYEGKVRTAPSVIIKRDVPPLDRCTIVDERTGSRLLVLRGDSIVLGKSREKADIVTWKMPRSEENDYETRKISGQQCRLSRAEDGLVVEQISRVNPTKVNGSILQGRQRLETGMMRLTELELPAAFGLRLNPLPMPSVPTGMLNAWQEAASPVFRRACEWSERVGCGALLIERTDELANVERYLWLISTLALPPFDTELAGIGETDLTPDVLMLAMPNLHMARLTDQARVAASGVEPGVGSAFPVSAGDSAAARIGEWRVRRWEQDLG